MSPHASLFPSAYAQPSVNIKAGSPWEWGLWQPRHAIAAADCGAGERRPPRRQAMPRHAHYVPHGVIPAVLLPFNEDLSIDENSFRSHLRDVAATKGLAAITINAHSTE